MQMFCLPQRGKHCPRNEPPGSWKSGRQPSRAHLGGTEGSGSHVCVLSCFSRVRLFATSWTVCSRPGSSVHGIFWARILEWVATSPLGHLPNPGIEPMSSASPVSQANSLPLSRLGSQMEAMGAINARVTAFDSDHIGSGYYEERVSKDPSWWWQ